MDVVLLFPGQGSQKPGMGRDLADAFPVARAVFETVASTSSMPGPEKKRRRALPMVPSAGKVNCEGSKTRRSPRGLVRNERDWPLHAGVSTPSLLIPLGMVPSSDVSLLLSSVTGKPVVKRAIPDSAQPPTSQSRRSPCCEPGSA